MKSTTTIRGESATANGSGLEKIIGQIVSSAQSNSKEPIAAKTIGASANSQTAFEQRLMKLKKGITFRYSSSTMVITGHLSLQKDSCLGGLRPLFSLPFGLPRLGLVSGCMSTLAKTMAP